MPTVDHALGVIGAATRARAAWLVALALWALAGCGDGGLSCGPGTVDKAGACVLVDAGVACGAGTTLRGGLCVPVGDGGAGGDAAADGGSGDGAGSQDGGGADADADGAGQEDSGADAAAGDSGGDAACVPDCANKVCGSDGCGGSCGTCTDVAAPICVAGACAACQPSCEDSDCGDDGCGGSCGSCTTGLLCASGSCVAPPPALSCIGHCGGDAPGGCSCAAGCADAGNCCADVALCGCVPACAGKTCGDDGCGGSCGGCTVGASCKGGVCGIDACADATCNFNGDCALEGCTCDAGFAGAFCDQCAPGYVNYPTCAKACADAGDCADGEACTADACDKALGCVNAPTSATCTDGDPCTQGDACLGGSCQALGPPGCDDANPCTVDACEVGVGCTHLPAPATACDDGDACTAGDACNGGACKGGAAVDCDDGNACSDDACAPASGCGHVGNDAFCDDGNPCTTGALCDGLACVAVASKPCDDGNACTVDACDAKSGTCAHAPAAALAPCDDGDLCTQGDGCDGKGGCDGGAKICVLSVQKGLVARFGAAQASTLAAGADKKVTAWQDQSGGGHHLAVADAALAPTLLPVGPLGRPGLRLDGAAALVSAPFAQGDAATVAAVICGGAGADLGPIASQGGWTLGGKGKAPSLAVGGATAASAGPIGACHVVVARVGAGSVDLARSATLTTFASAQATLTPTQAALKIGGGGASGVLGELLLYDRALSDAERDAVAATLRTAWGLPRPQPDVAWYDASDLATVVTATGAEPSSLGAPVEQWRDKSGQQRHATPMAGEAPTYVQSGTSNGRPALRFDGAQVRLQTQVAPTSPTLTLFAVFELDKPQALGTVVAHGDDAAYALRRKGGSGAKVQWQVAKEASAAELDYQLGGWQLVTARQDGVASLLYADASAPKTAQATAAVAPATLPLLLGNGPAGGRSMGGFIAEVQAFSTALSATDRALVELGLRVKYGL